MGRLLDGDASECGWFSIVDRGEILSVELEMGGGLLIRIG